MTDEQLDLCVHCSRQSCSAIKKDEILPFVTTWKNQKGSCRSEGEKYSRGSHSCVEHKEAKQENCKTQTRMNISGDEGGPLLRLVQLTVQGCWPSGNEYFEKIDIVSLMHVYLFSHIN